MWRIGASLCLLFLAGAILCAGAVTSGESVDLEYTCIEHSSSWRDLTPIILIHGLTADRYNWEGIYEALAKETGRKVCLPDVRNHGKSPKSEEFTYDLLAKDIVHLMDRLNFQKAVLLGHSLGGKTAVVVALQHPDRVDKLIVEDMRPNGVVPLALAEINAIFQILSKSLESVPDGLTEEEAKEAVYKFIKDQFTKKLPKEQVEEAKQSIDELPSKLAKYLECPGGKCHAKLNLEIGLKAFENPDMLGAVHDGLYMGDALFLYGKKSDFKVDEDEENIRRLFPNARLVGIEDATHTVHEDKPQEYLSEVLNFLKDRKSEL